MIVRGVIWDVDGTIADTLPMIIRILQEAIVKFNGPNLTPSEIEERFGPTEQGVLKNVLGEDSDTAYRFFLAEYEERHEAEVEVFEGVHDIIATLADHGVRQAVVTGKGAESAAITLERLELSESFEFVISGSIEGQQKDKAIVSILASWGLPGDEVVYIGDHPTDVVNAHAAGVNALVAGWRYGPADSWMGDLEPHARFDSTADLATWLETSIA
ncbi:MAG: HAD family hydrolase [Acidimicrobiia bacterium]